MGSIPIFAIAPMMIMWFGVGFFSKFMMAFFSTFLITTLNSYFGAIQAPQDLIDLLNSFKASKLQCFLKVNIPSSLSWVVASFKLTIGFSLLGAFIGEFISSDKGLGHRILRCGGLFDIPGVISGIVLIAFLALCLNYFVEYIGSKILYWKN